MTNEDARQQDREREAASPEVGGEQALSDADQGHSDEDRSVSETDETSATVDQHASNRDQAAADREYTSRSPLSELQRGVYEASRVDRETSSSERLAGVRRRERTSRDRHATAAKRAQLGETADPDAQTHGKGTPPVSQSELALLEELAQLRAELTAEREGAAKDRLRAAEAVRQRERLESELRSAHLDGLTGAYRREMGALAIGHEIERMRRSGGNLVLAFIDVDGLKAVNDRHGHAAGDRALEAVARLIRERLRPFDPFVRYGGDEFICVLGHTELVEAERRFAVIAETIEAETDVGISVGFATLSATDTADELTERADAAMLEVKREHRSRGRPPIG